MPTRRVVVFGSNLTPSLLLFLFPNLNALESLFLGCSLSATERHCTLAEPEDYCSSLSKNDHGCVDSEVYACQNHDPDADLLARLGLSELLGQAEHEVDRDEHGALIDELGIVVDLLLKGLEQDQDDDPDQVEEQR